MRAFWANAGKANRTRRAAPIKRRARRLSGRAVSMYFSRAAGDIQLRCLFFQKSCFYTTCENAKGHKACGLGRFLPERECGAFQPLRTRGKRRPETEFAQYSSLTSIVKRLDPDHRVSTRFCASGLIRALRVPSTLTLI